MSNDFDYPEGSKTKEQRISGMIYAELREARDRCLMLARERNHWKAESLEQAKLLAMSADREEKLRSKILMQARAYRGEDLKDNSRWSIFNEGRAQALEKLADETWP